MRSVAHIIARILIEAELKRVQANEQGSLAKDKDTPQDVPGQHGASIVDLQDGKAYCPSHKSNGLSGADNTLRPGRPG
jgi:hypothetical protein